MKFLCLFVASLAIVAISSAKDIQFEECSGKTGVVTSVNVEPCTEEPCKFKKGQQVKMSATIKPKETIDNAQLTVVIDMEGIEVEYPDIESDLCKTIKCPLNAGETATATYEITAEDFFPDMLTDMKWEAKDKDDNVVFCAKAKVGIQS